MKVQLKQYEAEEEERINTLVLSHINLVKHIINKLEIHLPYGMDKEDLISIGNFGLIEAARKFDLKKQVKFSTFAYIRIRGAILDEIRKSSFGGQAVLRKNKKIQDVYTQLSKDLGHMPSSEEVAQSLDITVEKLEKMLDETSGAYLLSLDDYLESDEKMTFLDRLSSDDKLLDSIIDSERLSLVEAAIQALPDQEKMVLSLYYQKELSLKEIGLVLDRTESRISQIHKKAILKIKAYLDNQEDS
jgi:RNA polymerase sigma factor FliA